MRRIEALIFLILSAIYVLFILSLFHPMDKCLEEPIYRYDYSYHFSNIVRSQDYLARSFEAKGYNPNYEAGTIEGQGLSSKIILLFKAVLFPLPDHFVFNFAVLVLLLSLPFLNLWIKKLFLPGQKGSTFALYYSIIFFTLTDLGREFIIIGHFGFLIAILMALAASAFFFKYLYEKKTRYCLFQALVAAIALFSHPLSVLLLTIMYLLIAIYYRGHVRLKEFIVFVLCFTFITILPNMQWLPPFLEYFFLYHEANSLAPYLQSDFSTFMIYRYDFALFIFVVLLTLLIPKFRRKNAKNYRLLIIASSFFGVIGIFGTQIGLGDLQPIRFLIASSLIVAILISSTSKLKTNLLLSLIFLILAFIKPPTFNLPQKLGCGLPKEGQELWNFIKSNKGRDARIHVQQPWGLQYYSIRILPIFDLLDIPNMGTPLPVPLRYTHFYENTLWGKGIDYISAQEFVDYNNRYNIDRYLVYSDQAKKFLDNMPDTKLIFNDGLHAAFEYDLRKKGYCYKCNATVRIFRDSIQISNIRERKLAIKLHFTNDIEIMPPSSASIYKESIPGDPYGFIGINNPQREKEISILLK